MNQFWQDHWWLLIPLGAFTIPLAGIAMGAWSTWLHHQSRNRALEALKVYAQQGREPPVELLRAVGGRKWDWQGSDADIAASVRGAVEPEAIRARTEYHAARAAARAARWRVREPVRRWNNAIFLGVGAGALYFAAGHYAADHVLSDRLYVGAIMVGALAAAAILAAVLATVFRPQ